MAGEVRIEHVAHARARDFARRTFHVTLNIVRESYCRHVVLADKASAALFRVFNIVDLDLSVRPDFRIDRVDNEED